MSFPDLWSSWGLVGLELATKATLIVLGSVLIASFMKRASASARHTVWLAAIVSLIVLPVVSLVLPTWHLRVLPDQPEVSVNHVKAQSDLTCHDPEVLPTAQRSQLKEVSPIGGTANEPDVNARESSVITPESTGKSPSLETLPIPLAANESDTAESAASHPKIPWGTWMVVVWLLGVLVVLARPLIGVLVLTQISHRASKISDTKWQELLAELKQMTGVKRHVTLIKSDRITMPMMWGVLRPSICVPPQCNLWTPTERRMILCHELMHLRRADWLWQWVAKFAIALHWYNPLVWMVAMRLQIEAEMACDDGVLAETREPTDYAECLYRIVKLACANRPKSLAALPMARPSEFSRRLTMILNTQKQRDRVSRTMIAMTLLTTSLLVATVASVQLAPVQAADGTALQVPVKNNESRAVETATLKQIAEVTKQLNSKFFKERTKAEQQLLELGKKLINDTIASIKKPDKDATAKEISQQYKLADKKMAGILKTAMYDALDANAKSADAGLRAKRIRTRINNLAREQISNRFNTLFRSSWLAGRSGELRTVMLRKGGNKKSEAAVTAALAWIVKQQNADGSWAFSTGRTQNAATGMSLMALLGTGITHQNGVHAKSVNRGLGFLMKNMSVNGSLVDKGSMYSQAIASLALVEAFGMSRDPKLKVPAQKTIDFIVAAQDPIGGGWRYRPGQKGDTSVFGWQMAVLQAARAANLKVPEKTFKLASTYLDNVAADGGSRYGYTTHTRGSTATTCIGLLGRVYLGTKIDDAGLVKGNKWLTDQSPPLDDLYTMFFAHEFMRQFGGTKWATWNQTVRDSLVNRQIKSGEEKGSWDPKAFGKTQGGSICGRLYVTSMAVLNLEVYYRNGTAIMKMLK